ncbi:PepSY domain-containing protein [Citricoccus sp. NR2]|uniref:PepSY domain-containing protein n=1 Tax=Citricoccus sp. NR2 TaxID=3004095 RepID=UPI0022DD7A4E|nr:peptidase [Citricoccus sp. NR2]WBL18795.1 peptidase [Citricoccus sp. NR2]
MKNKNTATIRRFATTTGAALAAVALLAACTTEEGSGDTVSQPPIDTPSATVTDSGAADTTESTDSTDQASAAASDDAGNGDAAAQGDDPVFGVIDAVLAEYADGIIVDIDREDRGDRYDIDVVVGNEIIELEVTVDGEIREDEREGDDDDIREAQQATVTAADAIREALNQHEGSVLDEAQLDEDDDRLVWDIDLDDENGNDLAELEIPAN